MQSSGRHRLTWKILLLVCGLTYAFDLYFVETASAKAPESPENGTKKRRKAKKPTLKVVPCPQMNLEKNWTKVEEKEQAHIYRSKTNQRGLVVRCENSAESPKQVIAGWKSESAVTRTSATSFYFDKRVDKSLIRVYVHYLERSNAYVTAALVIKEPTPKEVDSAHSDMLGLFRVL